ncbi:N-acetyl-D-Glu racemase DgcA [Phreatobacter cathodiphilus]|uniref:Dipeptide epimerase n=1 Tax=Phreatobacter cathodiphilus TaxID=1868589 RepID=A0A2S0N920_9HYPH|nr:N-acetyl-D-Glu racemase DgcA [Phreatobacter cathodiphilus]AVO44635.1 dipeptide epimerase [Phreatobacter cathodiphilus]
MASRELTVRTERWPIAGTFTISRGSRTEAVVVVCEIREGSAIGRAECVPYPRYGESVDGVAADIEAMVDALDNGLDRQGLLTAMKPGAARNAVDCALWDLEAKLAGKRAWDLAGMPTPKPLTTVYTISLSSPEEMAEQAARCGRPHLKIKLGGEGDADRLAAIRAAVPDATLVIDANEGWTPANLEANLAVCERFRIALVEQPLPASDDEALRHVRRPIPICADESVHDRPSLAKLAGKYDAINVKLDKTGGLTEAFLLVAEAEKLGLKIMTGCMLGTSLSMAPATLIAQRAFLVDLDGPLLLREDRPEGLRYEGATVYPPTPSLWG